MNRRRSIRGIALAILVSICGTASSTVWAAAGELPDWLRVDYSELVDRRRPSHSGETVGDLLRRLAGRPLPPAGEREEDRIAHGLLDPLVEPYAFVLPDALDSLAAFHDPPYVDVGSLWLPGGPQPAWAELLRSRRYVVESDGIGSLRVFLPWEPTSAAVSAVGFPTTASADAARAAWASAWPVLRHVFTAERRRLGGDAATELPPLDVEVHAYRHLRARSAFELGTAPLRMTVDDTRPGGERPPLDLRGIRRFLAAGLRLEGARIDDDGTLRLLGSRVDEPPSILGSPPSLADVAVAYRAVFHGGMAEPYMSLDRGYFAEESIVNYGGRLRDTSLGMVSLLCDIRFKTFSLGLDILRGDDRRGELRSGVPEFRTHLERLAADPRSRGLVRQQTRLWFYPDDVDLTVSPEGDVLVLRKVRMSAASERFEGGGEAAAPWTLETVEEINRDYDALATLFPEMGDLDEVVRLLSLFAWLRYAEGSGRLLPELDSLLAVELPERPTPRSFPQMIAFNVLPAPETPNPVLVVDRVPYATAVSRLNPPSGRPMDARRRYGRAIAALDPREPQHAAMLAELSEVDVDSLDPSAVDLLAYRAGRTRLLARTSTEHYRAILGELDEETRQSLARRQASGEPLRPITLGIGGLDLDMGQALARAGGQRLRLNASSGAATSAPARSPRPAGPPAGSSRERWRRDSRGLPVVEVPSHGLGAKLSEATARDHGSHRLAVDESPDGEGKLRLLAVFDADGPEARSRRVVLDRRGSASRFERVEQARRLDYGIERNGPLLKVRARAVERGTAPPAAGEPERVPTGLVEFELLSELDTPLDTPQVAVRLEAAVDGRKREMRASVPRGVLQRLVLGPEADPAAGRPLPPFVPPAFAGNDTVMVMSDASRFSPPWEGGLPPRPGEEDPLRLAGAMNRWWAAEEGGRVAVVGVDPVASPARWRDAPAVGSEALLLLPEDGFPGSPAERRAELAAAWEGLPLRGSLAGGATPQLVVLASAESPARLGSRIRSMARDPAMKGKLLAAWSLAGPVREDLPAALLAEGNLAGLGIASSSVVDRRRAAERLSGLRDELRSAEHASRRPERLGGLFVWHY